MRIIQSISGHSSVNGTEQYSDLDSETLNAAMGEKFVGQGKVENRHLKGNR